MRGVLIIESPGLADITTGDRRGTILAQQLQLLRLPCRAQAIHTKDLLLKTIVENHPQTLDAIHITAHGKDGAIYFTDGSCMTPVELQLVLAAFSWGRLVALDACETSEFRPNDDLARLAQTLSQGMLQPPKCVLTMVGPVRFVDSVLSWALFYRHLNEALRTVPNQNARAREIHDSLGLVKAASLSKICAAYWYEKSKRYVNISPWADEDGSATTAIENEQMTSA